MVAGAVNGEARGIRLGRGVIRYREVGEGPAILFVHGRTGQGGSHNSSPTSRERVAARTRGGVA